MPPPEKKALPSKLPSVAMRAQLFTHFVARRDWPVATEADPVELDECDLDEEER